MTENGYCWTCGNTGEVRAQPFDDLAGYVECDCQYGVCGCGCCEADGDEEWIGADDEVNA